VVAPLVWGTTMSLALAQLVFLTLSVTGVALYIRHQAKALVGGEVRYPA